MLLVVPLCPVMEPCGSSYFIFGTIVCYPKMTEKHGNLSIDSDNLFPIIKKWLYSDHDIFYRELISNGCDACDVSANNSSEKI